MKNKFIKEWNDVKHKLKNTSRIHKSDTINNHDELLFVLKKDMVDALHKDAKKLKKIIHVSVMYFVADIESWEFMVMVIGKGRVSFETLTKFNRRFHSKEARYNGQTMIDSMDSDFHSKDRCVVIEPTVTGYVDTHYENIGLPTERVLFTVS